MSQPASWTVGRLLQWTAEYLKGRGVTDVYVCGLATDYCVRATAVDARSLGYATTLLTDAVAAVDLKFGDGARALLDMTAIDVRFSTAAKL